MQNNTLTTWSSLETLLKSINNINHCRSFTESTQRRRCFALNHGHDYYLMFFRAVLLRCNSWIISIYTHTHSCNIFASEDLQWKVRCCLMVIVNENLIALWYLRACMRAQLSSNVHMYTQYGMGQYNLLFFFGFPQRFGEWMWNAVNENENRIKLPHFFFTNTHAVCDARMNNNENNTLGGVCKWDSPKKKWETVSTGLVRRPIAGCRVEICLPKCVNQDH